MLPEHEFLRQRSSHSTGVDSVIINIILHSWVDVNLSSFRQNVVPDPEIVRHWQVWALSHLGSKIKSLQSTNIVIIKVVQGETTPHSEDPHQVPPASQPCAYSEDVAAKVHGLQLEPPASFCWKDHLPRKVSRISGCGRLLGCGGVSSAWWSPVVNQLGDLPCLGVF